jgi:hypothetical protein
VKYTHGPTKEQSKAGMEQGQSRAGGMARGQDATKIIIIVFQHTSTMPAAPDVPATDPKKQIRKVG